MSKAKQEQALKSIPCFARRNAKHIPPGPLIPDHWHLK